MSDGGMSTPAVIAVVVVIAVIGLVGLGLAVSAYIKAQSNSTRTSPAPPPPPVNAGQMVIREGTVWPVPHLGDPDRIQNTTIAFDPTLPSSTMYSVTTEGGGLHVNGAFLTDVTTMSGVLSTNVFSQMSTPPLPLPTTTSAGINIGFAYSNRDAVTVTDDTTTTIMGQPILASTSTSVLSCSQYITTLQADAKIGQSFVEVADSAVTISSNDFDIHWGDCAHAFHVQGTKRSVWCLPSAASGSINTYSVLFGQRDGASASITPLTSSYGSTQIKALPATWRAFDLDDGGSNTYQIFVGGAYQSNNTIILYGIVHEGGSPSMGLAAVPSQNISVSIYSGINNISSRCDTFKTGANELTLVYITLDNSKGHIVFRNVASATGTTTPSMNWSGTAAELIPDLSGYSTIDASKPQGIWWSSDGLHVYMVYSTGNPSAETAMYESYLFKLAMPTSGTDMTVVGEPILVREGPSKSSLQLVVREQANYPGETAPVVVVTDGPTNASLVISGDLTRVLSSLLPELGSSPSLTTSVYTTPNYSIMTSGYNVTTYKRSAVQWKTLSSSVVEES